MCRPPTQIVPVTNLLQRPAPLLNDFSFSGGSKQRRTESVQAHIASAAKITARVFGAVTERLARLPPLPLAGAGVRPAVGQQRTPQRLCLAHSRSQEAQEVRAPPW